VTQPPESELPTASQSTLLLQKRKEMQEVQQQLDRKKEEFRARMQRCQEKEVDLAARQEDIKEQVRKFDKFLKDNDAKRVRADRKVQEEKKASVQKENEKHELQQILNEQNEKRAQLKLEVRQILGKNQPQSCFVHPARTGCAVRGPLDSLRESPCARACACPLAGREQEQIPALPRLGVRGPLRVLRIDREHHDALRDTCCRSCRPDEACGRGAERAGG
jgi:hypothetical protein